MGLAPFCKDTFFGQCRLRVWRRSGGAKQGPPLVDATSATAALEVPPLGLMTARGGLAGLRGHLGGLLGGGLGAASRRRRRRNPRPPFMSTPRLPSMFPRARRPVLNGLI